MRIVVDTNIAFSAILNTDSRIARIILQSRARLNFYSTDLLLLEIEEHKNKLKELAGYSDFDLNKAMKLITAKIRFIDARLIPAPVLIGAQNLLESIDIDDTEFVALTNHISGKLWSGDKALLTGLKQKGWNHFVSTRELVEMIRVK
jgi:predicted nucleic acid-binding protein